MSLASRSGLLLKWPQEQSNAHRLRLTTHELNPSSLEDFLFSAFCWRLSGPSQMWLLSFILFCCCWFLANIANS